MEITIQKHSLRLDTRRYTLEDIQKEVMEDFSLLVSLGYDDLLNKEVRVVWGKKVRAFGTCKRIGVQPSGKMLYEIQINKEYIAVGESKEVHNTIMHECIHCIVVELRFLDVVDVLIDTVGHCTDNYCCMVTSDCC